MLRSGELARAAEVSADTLHHYEKLGLLAKPPRTRGGYRLYPPEALAEVQMIRSAVRVGFTLAELAEVLKERRAGRAPCKKVAALAARHVDELNRAILDLTLLRDWLARTTESWDLKANTLNHGQRAGLLESLPKPNDLNRQIAKGNLDETDMDSLLSARIGNNPRAGRHEMPHAARRS